MSNITYRVNLRSETSPGNGGMVVHQQLPDLEPSGSHLHLNPALLGEVQTLPAFKEQVLDAIAKAPTYIQPKAGLSAVPEHIELGSTGIVNGVSVIFHPGDAGAPIAYQLKKDGIVISNTQTTNVNIGTIQGNITLEGKVFYEQGPVKTNNLGNLDDRGRIEAGSVTFSRTIIGTRLAFFGVDQQLGLTSAIIRSWVGKLHNPVKGTKITIVIHAGAEGVMFAIPSYLNGVSSVAYLEAFGTDVKGVFTVVQGNVAGANGFSPISYDIYYFYPPDGFDAVSTYIITI